MCFTLDLVDVVIKMYVNDITSSVVLIKKCTYLEWAIGGQKHGYVST